MLLWGWIWVLDVGTSPVTEAQPLPRKEWFHSIMLEHSLPFRACSATAYIISTYALLMRSAVAQSCSVPVLLAAQLVLSPLFTVR